MPAPAPLLSVVLVCRNPGPQIRTAVESVWLQQTIDHELILVDGASTDGTLDWLQAHRAKFTTLISEPDHGVYDAMDKGVGVARGTWLFFLGADDQLEKGSLDDLIPVLQRTKSGVVVGEAIYKDGRNYRMGLSKAAVRRNFVHHQAACYRRNLFAVHGNFEKKLQIMADYEFNLRLLKAGVEFHSVPTRIAVCGTAGLSDAANWIGYREEITVRHRYFPFWQCWLWDAGSVLRFLRKKILRTVYSHG